MYSNAIPFYIGYSCLGFKCLDLCHHEKKWLVLSVHVQLQTMSLFETAKVYLNKLGDGQVSVPKS